MSKISKQYKSAIFWSLFLQLGILTSAYVGFYASIIFLFLCIPSVAYWIMIPIIIYRRPVAPTKDDLMIVRTGYPIFILLIPVGIGIYLLFMKLIGAT